MDNDGVSGSQHWSLGVAVVRMLIEIFAPLQSFADGLFLETRSHNDHEAAASGSGFSG